jgi:hypothetical protein
MMYIFNYRNNKKYIIICLLLLLFMGLVVNHTARSFCEELKLY